MSDKVVEFIPREEWEKQLAAKAEGDTRLNLPRELNRKRVVQAFQDAFEMTGGTTRLVEFANTNDENYATFIKLYSRLLPSQASADLVEDKETILKHVLPPSKLDE